MSRGEAYGGVRIARGLLTFISMRRLREINNPFNERNLKKFYRGFTYGNAA